MDTNDVRMLRTMTKRVATALRDQRTRGGFSRKTGRGRTSSGKCLPNRSSGHCRAGSLNRTGGRWVWFYSSGIEPYRWGPEPCVQPRTRRRTLPLDEDRKRGVWLRRCCQRGKAVRGPERLWEESRPPLVWPGRLPIAAESFILVRNECDFRHGGGATGLILSQICTESEI